MARFKPSTDGQEPGGDSFLDVVANIVGILIILVIVVGVRVKHWQSNTEDESVEQALAQLAEAKAEAGALQRDNMDLGLKAQELAQTAARRYEQRATLAAQVAAAQKDFEARQAVLDERTRDQLELQRQVALASAELDEANRQKAQAASLTTKVETIETYPTPISQTVFGKEAHFQLRGGRIAFVPMDDLIERCVAHARERTHLLRSQSEIADTVGPVGGFRLRYELERQDVPLETQLAAGTTASVVRLRRFTLVPTSTSLGETLDAALADGSQLRNELTRIDSRTTTITLWTYPESFAEFRALRKELYRQGYQVAGRPLPEGQPIGGSPEGSKSAAQ